MRRRRAPACRPTAIRRQRSARTLRRRRAECPPLALGHPSPHTELDTVVQGIRKALGAHRASGADRFGPVLCRALDEQFIWISSAAGGLRTPVGNPAHAGAVLSRIGAPPRRQTAYSPSPVEDVTEGRQGATPPAGPILDGPNGLWVRGRSPNGVT